jgi:hypothetical protein
MQRPRTRGATEAGETKRRAMQQSPRRQTAMMARHFTAERSTDAPIPALGLDTLMPAAPFKCSLLNALDTSPTSSSTTSSSDSSPSDGSFCLLRHHRIRELGGETPRAPPGQPEQGEGSRPGDARSRRPPAHWGADAGRGEPRCPRDLHCLDPSGSYARRCSECAVAGGGDAGSLPRGEHRSGAPGGGGRPGPPPQLQTIRGHRRWHPPRSEWSRLPAAWSSSSSSRLGASSPSDCPTQFGG